MGNDKDIQIIPGKDGNKVEVVTRKVRKRPNPTPSGSSIVVQASQGFASLNDLQIKRPV